jgi:antitoxin VapB
MIYIFDIRRGNSEVGLMETAKIFWSGRSQAVRLPKSFRFDVGEVSIKRRGAAVILEPVVDNWDWLDAIVGPVDTDFAGAALEPVAPQERPDLAAFD